jgi:hypothetical protein
MELRAGPAGFYGGGDAAAGAEDAFDYGPNWVGGLDDVFEDLVDDVLLKDAEVAVAVEIFLERFEFEAALAGHVADGENAEVGQAGFGADAGQFGVVDFNLVAGELVAPGFDGGKLEIEAGFGVIVGVAGFCGHSSYCMGHCTQRIGCFGVFT